MHWRWGARSRNQYSQPRVSQLGVLLYFPPSARSGIRWDVDGFVLGLTAMPRKPIPTVYLSAVVVRQGEQFLLVQEHKRGAPWSLPAGRAEPGESLAEAAVRETLEESGVRVRLTGILRIEHGPRERQARLRAVFLGEPVGDATPKQQPDKESLGARWVTIDEVGELELRRREVEDLLRYVAAGGAVFPLAVLQEEGTPYFGIGDAPDESHPTRLSGALRWLRMAMTGEHPIDG